MHLLLRSVCCSGVLIAAVQEQASGFLLGRETVQLENRQAVVTLNWEPVPGARWYRVLVAEDAAFTRVLANRQCQSNILVLNGLPQDCSLHWKVAAKRDQEAGTWNEGGPGRFQIPSLADLRQCIDIPRGTPSVDGRIHPGEWGRAAAINLKCRTFGSAVLAENLSPRGRLLWDETNLYVLGEMAMLNRRAPQATATQRDGAVWTDDDFELFLQPAGDCYYYHFGANAKGTLYDGRNTNGAWNGNWQVVTATDDGALRILFVVPWAQLGGRPTAKQNWRFNLTATFAAETVICSWAGVVVPHEPEKFGTLRLVE